MRLAPLMNPVPLAPTCEPGLPDLSGLQTRAACPEVSARNESHPPGPQGARGRPLRMRREYCCSPEIGIRFLSGSARDCPSPGLRVPQLGKRSAQICRFSPGLFVPHGSHICVPMQQPLPHRLLLPLASIVIFPRFPLIRGGVPTVTMTTDTLSRFTY